jgi:hypothetical protein
MPLRFRKRDIKVLSFFMLFNLMFAFWLGGCGEEKELSESILGSWKIGGNNSLINISMSIRDVLFLAEKDATLTFSRGGRFDLVATCYLMEKDSSGLNMTPLPGDVKFIITGSYDAYGSSIVFHCESSNSNIVTPSVWDNLKGSFRPKLEELEETFTSTLDASVDGSILELAGTRWKKV